MRLLKYIIMKLKFDLKLSLLRLIGLLFCTIINTAFYTILTLFSLTKTFVVSFTIISCCISFVILVYKIEPVLKNRFRFL